MRLSLSCGLALAAMLLPAPLAAQTAAVEDKGRGDIVVTGRRGQPSDWRVAETDHVIVLSNGRESELVQIARNLERLHFLMAGLTGRLDAPDDTVKLRITLIGDLAEFQAMDLRNLRWQQGPFDDAFTASRYYDPREDGDVVAATRIDQKAVIERGVSPERLAGLIPPASTGDPAAGSIGPAPVALLGLSDNSDLIAPANERSVPMSAESMLYAAYAQHFLLTYFPAAYPRWYLDGWGEIFSTLVVRGDGVLEYGRAPAGAATVLDRFGGYPLLDVLNGKYLTRKSSRTRWTPIHAWMLTHFLFFSDTRRPQLRRYLLALANGASGDDAAKVFGDLDAMARELRAYYRTRKPYDRLTYPAARAEAPIVNRLSKAGAAFVKGRLELGSRVEPPSGDGDLAARNKWLARLRADAARYSDEATAEVLLAEAECRIGHPAECAAAADRALAADPKSSAALAWKGSAMAALAAAGPAEARPAALKAARAMIARANRTDTDAVLPLLAYYRSFVVAGEAPPVIAIDGVQKAMERVPTAPSTRLTLGTALVASGAGPAAAAALRPVAHGPYDSPERAPAQAVLGTITAP